MGAVLEKTFEELLKDSGNTCEACKGAAWGVDDKGEASPCPNCNHDGAIPAKPEEE